MGMVKLDPNKGAKHGISQENVEAEISQAVQKHGWPNQPKKYWSSADERWYQTLVKITLPRLETRRREAKQ